MWQIKVQFLRQKSKFGGLKLILEKNERKQTHIKIQFYIRWDVAIIKIVFFYNDEAPYYILSQ